VQRKNSIYDISIAIGKLKAELQKTKALLAKDNIQIEKFDSNVTIQKNLGEDIFLNEIHE
jgi:hypothetical protein